MSIALDPQSPVAPYEQIRAAIARQAVSGSLPAGTRLPTVRQLAGELAVAVNTVARAYRELEKSGVIVTRGRLGTFVADADDAGARARESAEAYAAQARLLGLGVRAAVELVRDAYARAQP